MATTKNAAKAASTEAVKQITYLAAALKAPRITEAAARLADHARDAGWTHEDYLAAVLEREVAARNASGAQLRIRAAGFDARQDPRRLRLRPPTRRPQPRSALASGGYLTEHRNVVLLGPPGHRQDPPGHRPGRRRRTARTPRPVRHRHRLGRPPDRRPHRAGRLPTELTRLRRYG
jgi:hypothetical protein